ncbi:hypothetical protein ACKLNO_05135 [Neisseriaceae bacterium B1]
MKKAGFVLALCCCSYFAEALSVAPPWDSFVYAFDKNADNKLSRAEFLVIKKEMQAI